MYRHVLLLFIARMGFNIGRIRDNVRTRRIGMIKLCRIGLSAHALHPCIGIPYRHDRQEMVIANILGLFLEGCVVGVAAEGRVFSPWNLKGEMFAMFGFTHVKITEIAVDMEQILQEIRPGIEHPRCTEHPFQCWNSITKCRTGL